MLSNIRKDLYFLNNLNILSFIRERYVFIEVNLTPVDLNQELLPCGMLENSRVLSYNPHKTCVF